MAIEIDDDRKTRSLAALQGFFLERFDEELSAFRAEQLLDFFLETLGPQVYNQAVQDARIYMQRKLDDLDVEIHEVDIF
jgi:uncharacterized protein (DUF2164 family)